MASSRSSASPVNHGALSGVIDEMRAGRPGERRGGGSYRVARAARVRPPRGWRRRAFASISSRAHRDHVGFAVPSSTCSATPAGAHEPRRRRAAPDRDSEAPSAAALRSSTVRDVWAGDVAGDSGWTAGLHKLTCFVETFAQGQLELLRPRRLPKTLNSPASGLLLGLATTALKLAGVRLH